MSTIVINGVTYTGNNIRVVNNKVLIDGNDYTPDTKEITITVQGNINDLKVDTAGEIHVSGSVGTLQTTSGDVYCTNVSGSIKTISGDIECDTIYGNVETVSGDVSVGLISGNLKTVSGDVRYKK